jgi:DNA-binding LacI/PurR family transcriptional regulator
MRAATGDMQRRPSIYDVARVADVAPSTVSRAFSRPGRVNSGTAARIFAAARQVGYPFKEPLRLTPHRLRSLAVVVADITNPFYSEITRGAYDAAGESGYALLLSHTRGDGRLERDWSERELVSVDGVLLAGSRMSHDAIRMLAKVKPLVVLNRRVPDVGCVVTDIAGGMRRAVEHLAALGHEAVTYLAGPEASWADGMRWVALMEGCRELGLHFQRVGPCNAPTVSAGFDSAVEVLAQRSTAVIAYNDLMAVGVVKGMRRVRVRVPDDVSVISFDNVLSEIVDPELTTVAAPLRAMGIIGVQNLIAAVGGATPSPDPVVLPVKLLVRGSTAHRRRRSTPPALSLTEVSASSTAATRVLVASR